MTSSNPSAIADPDFHVFRNGVSVLDARRGPPAATPRPERSPTLHPATYLLDVYDCANGCDQRRKARPATTT